MSKLKRKSRGIESLKSRYGFMFILPWIIGLVLFFFIPMVQSLLYSFSEATIVSGDVQTEWVGFANYNENINVDPTYTKLLTESLGEFAYSLPIILVLSLILAMTLNQKFRGRLFFRALYFLPVIIASGQVMNFIFTTTSEDLASAGASASMASGMISIEDITGVMNLNTETATFISQAINDIFNLIWSCGIQIVLFLAGLQSIPGSLYEASKVEGATKWEEFWFITFPMLSRITLLVGIFTMVELFVNERTPIVELVYGKMRSGNLDISSAMIWYYFIFAAAIMGVFIFLFTKFILKRFDA